MTKRRALTATENEDAERLQAVWNREKVRLGIKSQEEMASLCGWGTQGAFSQYLRGVIPLNIKAVLKICDVLGVPVSEVSPGIASRLPVAAGAAASQPGMASLGEFSLTISLPKDELVLLRRFAENSGFDTATAARTMLIAAIHKEALQILDKKRLSEVLAALDAGQKKKRA